MAPNVDPIDDVWMSQLVGYYSAPDAKPAWIHKYGFNIQARIALEELRAADDFALDPSQLGIPDRRLANSNPHILAAAEVNLSLAIARYAWHARGGRLLPTELSLWLDYRPRQVDAARVLANVLAADDPSAGLRAVHPRHRQFEALRQAYLQQRGGSSAAGARRAAIPMGVRIRPGRRHSDVALARLRLNVPANDGESTLLDDELQTAIYEFMTNVAGDGYARRRGIDDDVRVALNGGSRGANRATMEQIRANMERWRWLPRDLGDFYVWNNLPEFKTRVVKDEETVLEERIIIGQVDTQTPVFSDEMLRVIFNPDWSVPESIKLASIWPNLRGGDYGVLKRRNMRIVHDGKEINPAKLKYETLNARDVPIVMMAGPGNPLGRIKFIFPNKHSVYMHDTTSKGLFDSNERTFSHGCIRVKNPQQFAVAVLDAGKGWNKADVAWQARSKTTVKIELDRKLPVHNTYFTLVADASGELKKLRDVYGHDKRVSDALNGVDVKLIAANDPARALAKKNEELASAAVVASPPPKKASRKKRSVAAVRPAARSSFFRPAGPPPPMFMGRDGRRMPPRRPRGFFFW